MGKVSMALIVIGLIPLVPAIVLTLISMVFPSVFPNAYWFNIMRVFVIGFLYIVAFSFIILGLIILKRDSE